MSLVQSRFPGLRGGMAAGLALAGLLAGPTGALAAGEAAAPDDTPTVKIGGVIFTDYTYTLDPTKVVDGNEIHPNAFNLGRAYLNVTGQLSHRLAFRITPDIFSASSSDSSSVVGSYVFRLKYAYGQFNLDDWLPKGSWIRLGVLQTPFIDYEEGAYRYRFQGPTFPDREGKLTSSDRGISARYAFPNGRGDVVANFTNGEGYNKTEPNDQKAFQVRGSLRPFPGGPLNGLRVAGFFDADAYSSGNSRQRWIANALFEHARLNAGFDFMGTTDQPSSSAAEVEGQGFSVWATPRAGNGWEALLRYDRFEPDKDVDVTKETTIGGVAYWFPLQKGVSGAVLLDYQQVSLTGTDDQKQIALHTLMSF